MQSKKTNNTEWKREAKEAGDIIMNEAKACFNFSEHLVASIFFHQYKSQFTEEAIQMAVSYTHLDVYKIQVL